MTHHHKKASPKPWFYLEFWEDDGEIRIGGRAGMVHLLKGDESEDGDRVSFHRWGKRNVVSYHFTELVLEITVLKMLTAALEDLTVYFG